MKSFYGKNMSVKNLLLVILVNLCLISGNLGNVNNSLARQISPRVSWPLIFGALPLSPWSVVRFSNENCIGDSARTGTCMPRKECIRKGGVSSSNFCARGFGVCCVLVATENGVAYGNNTLLKRDPFNGGVDVTYTILRMNEDICQFRLDVNRLYLDHPTVNGLCLTDYMTVSQDIKIDRVCGLTEDIHFYIEIQDVQFVTFTFHTDAGTSFDRDWEIYVSQYTCDMGAPCGCGQYYMGTSGKINIWGNIDPSPQPWYYIDNQKYTICVRWEAGYCSITYTETLLFQPACDDTFERPTTTIQLFTCLPNGPNTAATYTSQCGLQYFYVQFDDNSNSHITSGTSQPFMNPDIPYQQNIC